MRYKSIRGQLLLSFIALTLIPVVILGLLGPVIYSQSIETASTKYTIQMMTQLSRSIDYHIRDMDKLIELLLLEEPVQTFFRSGPDASTKDISGELAKIKASHPEIKGLLILNASDAYVSNELSSISRDPLTLESWYRTAELTPGQLHLFSRPVGRNLRTKGYGADDVVSIVKAVSDDGGLVEGVVLIDLDLQALKAEFDTPGFGQSGFFFIMDAVGGTVYAPVNPLIYRVSSTWIEPNQNYSVHKILGADYQIINHQSDLTKWTTVGVFSLENMLKELNYLRLFSLGIAGMAVILAVFASFIFTSSIAQPVISLRRLMKRVEEGDLTVRFETRKADEIGQLGHGFNNMLGEIENLIAQVYQEQHEKREAELRVLREQIKPHFLYNTLDTIHWMAQENGAHEVVKIVAALTNLFRIGLNRGKVMITVAEEIALVRSYLLIQKARYEDKFDYELKVDESTLHCTVIKLMLQPLVENALYHGIKEQREHGTIKIEVVRKDDHLLFSVIDDGVGLSPSRIKELNEALGTPGLKRESGFGLFNVNEQIRLNFGNRFGLYFVETEKKGTTLEICHPIIEGEFKVTWKVLIADDEPKIRRGLRASLEGLGLDLEVAAEVEDGELAYKKAQELRPDILLIDIMMPFLNGLELMEKLETLKLDAILIVVSGHDEFEYAQKALRLQAFDYLLKPVMDEQLGAAIRKAIAELGFRRKTNAYLGWANEQLQKNLPALRERFFREWLEGRLSKTDIFEGMQFLEIKLGKNPTLVLVRQNSRSPQFDQLKPGSRHLLSYTVRAVALEALKDAGEVLVCETGQDDLAIVVDPDKGFPLEEALEQLERRIGEILGQTPVVVFGLVPLGVEGLDEAFEDLLGQLKSTPETLPLVNAARNFIEKHYWRPDLSLEEVAQDNLLSPGYLSRLLKQETGWSFIEYLNRVRVNKSVLLMGDPTAKMFEVAEKVGYRSQHYFSRAFRRVLGVSPSEFRRGEGEK